MSEAAPAGPSTDGDDGASIAPVPSTAAPSPPATPSELFVEGDGPLGQPGPSPSITPLPRIPSPHAPSPHAPSLRVHSPRTPSSQVPPNTPSPYAPSPKAALTAERGEPSSSPHHGSAPSEQHGAGEDEDEEGDVTEAQRVLDDIRVEYHPLSGRGAKIYRFSHFKREQPLRVPLPENFEESHAPFESLDDFKFAEVALHAGLKEEQVNTLLSIIAKVRAGESTFSLRDYNHMNSNWERAAVFHPPV